MTSSLHAAPSLPKWAHYVRNKQLVSSVPSVSYNRTDRTEDAFANSRYDEIGYMQRSVIDLCRRKTGSGGDRVLYCYLNRASSAIVFPFMSIVYTTYHLASAPFRSPFHLIPRVVETERFCRDNVTFTRM